MEQERDGSKDQSVGHDPDDRRKLGEDVYQREQEDQGREPRRASQRIRESSRRELSHR